MPTPEPLYRLHLRGRRRPHTHAVRLSIMTGIFLAISAVAIAYATGVRIDPISRTLQSTGSVDISTPFGATPATVRINGKAVADRLPYRASYLTPGRYDISVSREGYNSWSRSVQVEQNTVDYLADIVLALQTPTVITADASWLDANTPLFDSGLTVKSGNELWVKDEFTTRFSKDITSARWYPGSKNVAYQAGSTIWLLHLATNTTQQLIELPGSDPVQFAFRDNGRTIVYSSPSGVQARELIER